MSGFEETHAGWEKTKKAYAMMSGPDKIQFWVHVAIAPALIAAAVIWAFGFGPAILLALGLLLFLGTAP